MNPSDANSPLATLRQLKELLDAGTLTPQEFETLKQQLVFGKDSAAPPAPAGPPLAPAAELAPPTPLPAPEPEAALPPVSNSDPDWLLAAGAPVLVADAPAAPLPPAAERRNPLTLVFALGGALVLLAVVLYLMLGSHAPDEHLTSTSQTATDSVVVAPEEGPQAAQITLPPAAAPETIRVKPTAPPPVAPAAASQFRVDSAAVAPAPSTPAPSKATPTPVTPAPTSNDSVATKPN